MATKDFSFSTKKKKTELLFNGSSNGKYSNFNLNLGHKYSENCFGETKTSKFGLKNDSYKFSGAFNSFKEEKNKSLFDSDKSWKIPFQLKQEPFGSRYSNISKAKDNEKSKNAFDSYDHGFSLSNCIQKNMHLYENPAVEEDAILTFKKDKKKFKNAIDRCLSSSPDLQDSWEFPRQQEDGVPQEPEVMNFTASQKLLRPSQNDESTADMSTSLPNDDDFDNGDDGAGPAYVSSIFDQEQRKIAEDNSLIGKKFKGVQKKSFTITSKIAKGGFGTVYRCVEDDENQKEYAIKCSDEEDFKMEIEVLEKANDAKTKRIYRLIDSGFDHDYNRIFIVIDLLGKSLADILEDKKGVEWDSLKWKAAEQCLIALQNLHELGYLHLDIKANNFAMGLGENEFMVYLIDFGLSMKTGSSREQSESANECYSSIAAMEEKKLGPKDDIESLMYMVKEFLDGQLPWEKLGEEKKKMLEMKQDLRNDESDVFKGFFGEPQSIFVKNSAKKNIKKNQLPEEAKTFPELLMIMRYIDSLKAEDVPDYNRILFFLQSAYEKAHQKAEMKYKNDMNKINLPDAREKFYNENEAKNDELEQIMEHCRKNVKKPENMAFFTEYDFDKNKYGTPVNPSGKYYKAIELNGKKMTWVGLCVAGACYRGSDKKEYIDIAYNGGHKHQLGEEVYCFPKHL